MKIGVIINPVAGKGNAIRIWQDAQPKFEAKFTDIEQRQTAYHQHASALCDELMTDSIDALVIVGGDGTLHQCLNAYMKQQTKATIPIVILRAGCGSDWVRNFKLRSLDDIINDLTHADYRWVDVGQIDLLEQHRCEFFINIASIGLSAEIAQHSMHSRYWKRWGAHMHYVLHSLCGMLRYQSSWINIRPEHHQPRNKLLTLGAMCNGRYFGGGMDIAPMARVDDGRLCCVLLEQFNLWQQLWNFPKIYRGQHIEHPQVEVLMDSSLMVCSESNKKVLIEADGELVGRLPARFTVLKQAIPMIV